MLFAIIKPLIYGKLYQFKSYINFFGCLIRLGLYKHPCRSYLWGSNGVLSQVPLSKNRFEAILCNFHFKDRGSSPIKGNWWDKLEPIFSILRQKYSIYWFPSINLTVDEVMLKFEGRST
jgi:Transposase IS4